MLLLLQAEIFKCSVLKPIHLSREWGGFSMPGCSEGQDPAVPSLREERWEEGG